MKLSNIHKNNFPFSQYLIVLRALKINGRQLKFVIICVTTELVRGLGLFPSWCHRLICITSTLCEHACKTVCDVKPGIDPCPSPARLWHKRYRKLLLAEDSDAGKNVKVSFGTTSILHFYGNSVWGYVHVKQYTDISILCDSLLH